MVVRSPVKFPQRFNLLPAWLANKMNPLVEAPSLFEILVFLFQPGKLGRAKRFISHTEANNDCIKVFFKGFPEHPLYYPEDYRWVDFCQTVDECFNPQNWHNFLAPSWNLTREDVVLDCGAAEGLFAFYASLHGSKVFAFEPDQGFCQTMKKTFANFPNTTIQQCALGHKAGTATLSRNEIFSKITSGSDGVQVPIRTLDETVRNEKVTFIKADVEGFEFRVILGAEDLIRTHRPKLAVTVYHPQNNVEEMKDFLRECCPDYQFATRGIFDNQHPVLFKAWV
jgi:FkbM family methyltransferase